MLKCALLCTLLSLRSSNSVLDSEDIRVQCIRVRTSEAPDNLSWASFLYTLYIAYHGKPPRPLYLTIVTLLIQRISSDNFYTGSGCFLKINPRSLNVGMGVLFVKFIKYKRLNVV